MLALRLWCSIEWLLLARLPAELEHCKPVRTGALWRAIRHLTSVSGLLNPLSYGCFHTRLL